MSTACSSGTEAAEGKEGTTKSFSGPRTPTASAAIFPGDALRYCTEGMIKATKCAYN